MIESALIFAGMAIAAIVLVVIVYSIIRPKVRIWPPKKYTRWTPVIVWVPTMLIFGTIFILGVVDWQKPGELAILRFIVGVVLVLAGNVVVWYEVKKFGFHKTTGASGTLRTEGLYRFSRNPQYVADIVLILGWLILSCSFSAGMVGTMGIAILILAPLAEETWLEETYGEAYTNYMASVRRYL